jgi:hypothetical protein
MTTEQQENNSPRPVLSVVNFKAKYFMYRNFQIDYGSRQHRNH